MKQWIVFAFILTLLVLGTISIVFADKPPLEVHFFYGETCPHCAAEQRFLNDIEKWYPDVVIHRYSTSNRSNIELLVELLKQYGAEQYFGSVPMTFVGDEFFPGFDNVVGVQIESALQRYLEHNGGLPLNGAAGTISTEAYSTPVELPFVGRVDAGTYSLPALAVLLGFLDGFNICSLGALVLILGLVLALRSRRKILLFGGAFILTTAVIYGFLIILWYQLFSFLAPYIRVMGVLIGLLGIGGGIFFFNQFLKYRKYGPACETTGSKIVARFSTKVQKSFRGPGGILTLLGIIFLFAVVITVVEFPCSAVVPVIFAGILAEAQLAPLLYLFYIMLFVCFYMLDELVIFLVAVLTTRLWMTSPKFVTWATLVEGMVLFTLGLYYFVSTLW